MGPLPKRKTPKARHGDRRSHLHLDKPALDTCSQCHAPKLPHTVCPTCGYYNGTEIIEIKGPKKKE